MAAREPDRNGGKKQKAAREFDWSTAEFAHFVLKFAYVGTDYYGLAWQDSETCPTVEGKLFDALVKTRLIRDRQTCGYSRCGRTDKGVHAAGNYAAMQLRVKPCKPDAPAEDYDYAAMLNGVLPADIRVLASRRAPAGFDARFSCRYRCYQYYFPLEGENLELMREAAAQFVGEHDFRNFCKIDVENVSNFRRRVLSVSVRRQPGEVGEFAVTGAAFLWHQVRCMAAVLLLVGRGLEQPSVVAELLDVEKHPRRPNYEPACEAGLVLRDCGFEDLAPLAPGLPPPPAGGLGDAGGSSAALSAAESLGRTRAQARRALAVAECLAAAAGAGEAPAAEGTAGARRPARHTPLLQRAACPSLEEKQQALEAKRRRKEGGPAPTAAAAPAAAAEAFEE